MFKVASGQ